MKKRKLKGKIKIGNKIFDFDKAKVNGKPADVYEIDGNWLWVPKKSVIR